MILNDSKSQVEQEERAQQDHQNEVYARQNRQAEGVKQPVRDVDPSLQRDRGEDRNHRRANVIERTRAVFTLTSEDRSRVRACTVTVHRELAIAIQVDVVAR